MKTETIRRSTDAEVLTHLKIAEAGQREAIAMRDAIENCSSPEWLAAHHVAHAIGKTVISLRYIATQRELIGPRARRHTDPVRTTWRDLHGRG